LQITIPDIQNLMVKDVKVSMLVELWSFVTVVLGGVWLKEIWLLVAKIVVEVWLAILEKEVSLVTAVKTSDVLVGVVLFWSWWSREVRTHVKVLVSCNQTVFFFCVAAEKGVWYVDNTVAVQIQSLFRLPLSLGGWWLVTMTIS